LRKIFAAFLNASATKYGNAFQAVLETSNSKQIAKPLFWFQMRARREARGFVAVSVHRRTRAKQNASATKYGDAFQAKI
jgi:hypothetical protein